MRSKPPGYQPPKEVLPGIYLAPIPIPIPLRYVNCYLMRGASGWTIVDAGYSNEMAYDAWHRTFAELGIRPQDVDQILVTHYHPDHLGAAGWLQQLTGADAYLHEQEFPLFEHFRNPDTRLLGDRMPAVFAQEGMDEETAAAIRELNRSQLQVVRPLPELKPVPSGSRIRLGDGTYEVIFAPGHTDGLAIFWDAGTGILLAHDMLLDTITPNVTLWPDGRPNPLADYLSSLERVEALGARIALTGHRALIHDVAARAREIRAHHRDRLDRMAAVCARDARGATAWEVCREIFPPEQLTVHQIRFAMGETLAHLAYMVQEGRLVKEGNRYRMA